MKIRRGWVWVALASCCSWSLCQAEDAKTTVVASGIDNPSGIAVQQPTGHLIIAARSGVFRLVPGDKPKLSPEVTGFDTDIYGKGPKYNIAALGAAMLSSDVVLIGDGSHPDESEVVLGFKIKFEAPTTPQSPKDAQFTLGPIKAGPDSAKGEGNYYGVTVNKSAVYVTCNGDDTKGWVARAIVKDGKVGELKPFIATKVATNVDAPVGITTAKDGTELVVGQMGEVNVAGDSLLTIYDAESGKLLKNYKTGLSDIAGVAYSPKTHKLYVVDFSWVDTTKGGLFELTVDSDGEKMTAKKIVSLDKPTSIAFGNDGKCYVTVFNKAEGDGAVVRIDADL